MVSLTNNQLTYIPAGMFESQSSLQDIDLSGHLITVIYIETFMILLMLKNINLANHTADIYTTISPNQYSLKNNTLSENQLTTVPTFIFSPCNLQEPDLSNNFITFDSIKESLKLFSSSLFYLYQ